jgi:hypothetical protein
VSTRAGALITRRPQRVAAAPHIVKGTAVAVGEEMPLSETDGIETGFDETFERKWIRFEHFAWAGMVVVVLLGIAGGFGRGPAARAHAAVSPIEVKYERLLRYQTPAEITVTSTGDTGIQRLYVDRSLIDRLQLQTVVPQPIGSEPRRDGAVLLFPETNSPSQVTLVAHPAAVGPSKTTVGLAEGPRVTFSQFVLP